MNNLFLRLVSFFYPVLERAGVDTDQLYNILSVKLMMDDRRPNAMFAGRRNSTPSGNVRNPVMVSFFTVLMGVFMGMVLFLGKAPYLAQTLYFSIFMVMMSLTLISDFTTILLDPRDQFILLPRPVNDRTIAISRILHISIYVLRLALLLGIPGMVMIGFIDGVLAVPLFFLQVLEATFLCIFGVNIMYLLLMRSVSPQKFKDIISYFQVGFSVLIFAVYYLLPRMIDMSVLEHIRIISHWWSWCLPPVWIAALNELLIRHNSQGILTGVLAVLGFTFPLVGLWLVAKVLAPGFNRRLAVIATSDGNSNSAGNTKKARKFGLIGYVANIVATDPVENAGFRITWKLAARTREFRMKVLPSFAYVPIYFVVFMFNRKNGGLDNIQNGHSYIFFLYFCTLILSTILMNVSMSPQYKSAWIYYAAPIGQPGKVLSGMYKAIITLYFFPYFLVISCAVVTIWGPDAIKDVIFAFLACTIYGMLMALFTVKGLPFSRPVIIKQGGGRFIISMMILIFVAGIGFAHWFIMRWENVIWIGIIPLLAINWAMLKYYKKQSWDSIELEEV
jgi:ABC-2 type transport system permease protein